MLTGYLLRAMVSYPALTHIGEEKDFTLVIEKALELGGYPEDKAFTGINGGSTVTTGFGHGTVLSVADKVIEAVKSGATVTFSWLVAATVHVPDATTTLSLSGRHLPIPWC